MLTFAEFQAILPGSAVKEQAFPGLLLAAEPVLQSFMVYRIDQLSEVGTQIYREALALQIDHMGSAGITEGNIQSYSANGVSTTFALKGNDSANVSEIARLKIVNAGLSAW